ncbi:hypothetical protein [Methylobacterium durans]|uniref:Uncharacterized protein n=1 Tax=Methylobacterium durans TaxID=2202825 RepID=A0A2U8W358_9HYPH|nr:hypothetical protein [Methylobacterium durans]AWN40509.1 hypothetical protein DK389_08175 [Methylobacterium durans]
MSGSTATFEQLRDWLFRDALPLWSAIGTDRVNGGFHERLTPAGRRRTIPGGPGSSDARSTPSPPP